MKAGGHDETPKRRGARKEKGIQIRYVDDKRGGGTTEQEYKAQGIWMGPVSVQRMADGRGGAVRSAATPLRDPG